MILEFFKTHTKCPALKYFFLSLAVLAIGYQVRLLPGRSWGSHKQFEKKSYHCWMRCIENTFIDRIILARSIAGRSLKPWYFIDNKLNNLSFDNWLSEIEWHKGLHLQVQHNYEDCHENDNYYFWHYSRHILDQLPKRSILLTSGDFSTNTFRYHTIGTSRHHLHVGLLQIPSYRGTYCWHCCGTSKIKQ